MNKRPEPEYSFQITIKDKNKISLPLLKYLKNKEVEKKRIKEERKRKESEKENFRDVEQNKLYKEKSPVRNKNQFSKIVNQKENIANFKNETVMIENEEKPVEEKMPNKTFVSYYKEKKCYNTENKYSPRKNYVEEGDYKSRWDNCTNYNDYRSKYEYEKKDLEVYQKKVEKYTEKTQERKMEEQGKLEQQQQENTSKCKKQLIVRENLAKEEDTVKNEASAKSDKPLKTRDNKEQFPKRIRNKDRPTIPIYRPGMFLKIKQNKGKSHQNRNNKE